MPDLKDTFDYLRGDLVYGQAADRGVALLYLSMHIPNWNFVELAMENGAWVTVDNYNSPLDNANWGSDSLQTSERVKAQRKEKKLFLKSWEAQYSGTEYEALATDFIKRLMNSRLAPQYAYNVPIEKIHREGWGELAENQYYLAIRRACKFGIEHVSANMVDAQIHFLLNRFDEDNGWLKVLGKDTVTSVRTGRTTMLITYSELRYAYKNRLAWGPKLKFYRWQGAKDNPTGIVECPAPWDDTTRNINVPADPLLDTQPCIKTLKAAWEDLYSPYKAKEYKRRVAWLKLNSNKYPAVRMNVDNWEDLGNTCLEINDIPRAINYYKDCIAAMQVLK